MIPHWLLVVIAIHIMVDFFALSVVVVVINMLLHDLNETNVRLSSSIDDIRDTILDVAVLCVEVEDLKIKQEEPKTKQAENIVTYDNLPTSDNQQQPDMIDSLTYERLS